jgi:hypothetical protein
MTWYLCDAHGYIEDIASLGGWRAFKTWAHDQPERALHDFIRDGETRTPGDLADALARLKAPHDVNGIRISLARAARACERAGAAPLLLSDGTDDADEDLLAETEKADTP